MCRFAIFSIFLMATTNNAFSQVSTPLGDRMNVMECSHSEVVAYMDLPDPNRKAMNDYFKWHEAFKSTELKRGEDDPTNCVAALYGDLSIMGKKLKTATDMMMATSIPSVGELANQAMNKLTESICGRIQAGADGLSDAVISQYNGARRAANAELVRRYGQRAMEKYVTDAVIPEDYQKEGLRYRNGDISSEVFMSNTRKRWSRELRELERDAQESLAGDEEREWKKEIFQ